VLTISLPHTFQSPSKKIHSPDDIRQFINSDSSKNFLGFIVSLSESIRSHKTSDSFHESTTLKKIVSIIETLIQWTEEIPPAQQ
jgi:serine/threonine-protein phosphatase 2A activator